MSAIQFNLVVYVVDTDKSSTENIKSTVNKLKDLFKEAITISYDIVNVLYDNRRQVDSVCFHEKTVTVECCYSKPLFLHNHQNRHRTLSLNIPTSFSEKPNIPYYLGMDYEAVTFTKNQVGADCAFIYPKTRVGVWRVISQLLPFPERITGGITITSSLHSGKNSIYGFIKHVSTSISQSLLELSVTDVKEKIL